MQTLRDCAAACGVLMAISGMTSSEAGAVTPAIKVASSSAFGIRASFISDNNTVVIGPVGAVAGSAPPAYNKKAKIASFNQHSPIVEGSTPITELYVDTTGILAHAASRGIGIDSVSAEGDEAIKTANLMITLYPPPPGASPVPEPDILLVGTGITSNANVSQVFPGAPVVTGAASFTSLSVSGALVGHQTLTYSGSAPANTILYQSPNVTVTLNRQKVTGSISCNPDCTLAPGAVTVHAIHIHLTDALIRGHTVSGDIVVGQSAAQ